MINTMNDNSGSNKGFSTAIDGGNIWASIYGASNVGSYPMGFGCSLGDTDWHHWTVTSDGSQHYMYKDGVECSSQTN